MKSADPGGRFSHVKGSRKLGAVGGAFNCVTGMKGEFFIRRLRYEKVETEMTLRDRAGFGPQIRRSIQQMGTPPANRQRAASTDWTEA